MNHPRLRRSIIGNGEGVASWLHIEDAATATVSAAEEGNPGVYLIANDRPLAQREWVPAFARWLNRLSWQCEFDLR